MKFRLDGYSIAASPLHSRKALLEKLEEFRNVRGSAEFNVRTTPKRLRGLKRDPWKEISDLRQSITVAAKRKLGMK